MKKLSQDDFKDTYCRQLKTEYSLTQSAPIGGKRDLLAVYELLYKCGLTANYTGFFYISYAVYLIQLQPERLLLVTKWLYPEIAKHYRTNGKAVERNIRTAVRTAWELRPEILELVAGGRLEKRPSNTRFLAILAAYLRGNDAA